MVSKNISEFSGIITIIKSMLADLCTIKTIYVATTVIIFFTSIVIITSVLLLFGIPITIFNIIFSLSILVVFIFRWKFINLTVKEKIYLLLVSFIAVVTTVLVSGAVYDQSWDGAAYHKQAIGLLRDGWNPIYLPSNVYNDLSLSSPYSVGNVLQWAEVYPKATWYFSASVYAITGNIESGKAYTLLISFITFCFLFDYFSTKLSAWISLIISLVGSLNPMVIIQYQSYYLDGFASCIVMCLIVLFSTLLDPDYINNHKMILLNIFSLIVLGCNTKFSILFFIASICVVFYIVYILLYRSPEYSAIKPGVLFLTLLLGAIVSIVPVGFSPYITNAIRYASPVFGFINQGTMLTFLGSGAIEGVNNPQMFIASIFGKMSHGEFRTLKDLIKLPFTYSSDELIYYGFVDTRLGGMGIFFSAIFLISLFILVLYLIKNKRNVGPSKKVFIVLTILILIESAFLPATFNMRYVGFIYILPVLAFSLLFEKKYIIGSAAFNLPLLYRSVMSVLLLVAIFINSVPWTDPIIKRIKESNRTFASLKKLSVISRNMPVEIVLYHPHFTGIYYNLKDNNIEYNIVDIEKPDESFDTTYGQWIYWRYSEKDPRKNVKY
jgi:hypothetical protein